MVKTLIAKFKESLISILPITFIVVVLGVTLTPIEPNRMIQFLISCVLLVVGMSFFTLGADNAMFPIGQHMGGYLSKKGKPWLMIVCCFALGLIITIAEPDLSVLAGQVNGVNNWVFIIAVSVGVGLFLVLGLLRILFKWKFNLVISSVYLLVFLMAIFVEQGIIPLSFDSGSVTTGPISVPFIMAFGIGIASARSANAKEDSFGLIGFASAGPILMVMLLMLVLGVGDASPGESAALTFIQAIPIYLKDVAIVILPIAAFFALFQIIALKLPKQEIVKIILGLVFTYIGIVIFLIGVNVGFLPVGKEIGTMLVENYSGLLIPICAVIGFCMAMVEPAVQVLAKQIEEITGGIVKKKTMLFCVAIGVAIALALCGVRALTGISILWILIPTYALTIVLSFIAPKLFVGMAFDSGGVATGAMATTFALPMMIGVSRACAFGTLAFCAIAPILVVLIFGVIYKMGIKKTQDEDESLEGLKRVDIIEYD